MPHAPSHVLNRRHTAIRQTLATRGLDALIVTSLPNVLYLTNFDASAAIEAAELAAPRQKAGKPVDIRDTQIAGIALARHAILATRNARHFADLEINVIDPWQDSRALERRSR